MSWHIYIYIDLFIYIYISYIYIYYRFLLRFNQVRYSTHAAPKPSNMGRVDEKGWPRQEPTGLTSWSRSHAGPTVALVQWAQSGVLSVLISWSPLTCDDVSLILVFFKRRTRLKQKNINICLPFTLPAFIHLVRWKSNGAPPVTCVPSSRSQSFNADTSDRTVFLFRIEQVGVRTSVVSLGSDFGRHESLEFWLMSMISMVPLLGWGHRFGPLKVTHSQAMSSAVYNKVSLRLGCQCHAFLNFWPVG